MTTEAPGPVTYLIGSIRLVEHVEHTDRTLTRRDELVSIDLRGHSVAEILDTLAAQIAVLQIRTESTSSPQEVPAAAP